MKLSRSLTIILLPLIYLWMVSVFSATTVDCVDCSNGGTPGITPTTGNSIQLASLVTSITERDRRFGCNFIRGNSEFDLIRDRVSVSPEEFFASARCDNEWAEEYREVPQITPIQLSLLNPPGRMEIILDLLEYFDRNVSDPTIVVAILNQRDSKNRTMLDFLEVMKNERYEGNESAQRALRRLRNEMCARGGTHSRRQSDCTARGRYAGVSI